MSDYPVLDPKSSRARILELEAQLASPFRDGIDCSPENVRHWVDYAYKLKATIERVRDLIDPAQGMAYVCFSGEQRHFSEDDIRIALDGEAQS